MQGAIFYCTVTRAVKDDDVKRLERAGDSTSMVRWMCNVTVRDNPTIEMS